MKHFLEYTLLKLFAAFVRPMPFGLAMRIGHFLGGALCHVFPYRKDVSLVNIRTAFPGISEERALEIYRESCRNLVITIFEYFRIYYLSDDRIAGMIEFEGEEIVAEIKSRDTGGIITTGHFGSFELYGSYMTIRGVPVTGVVKPMRNPRSEQFLEEIRAVGRIKIIKTTDGFKAILKAIKDGSHIGLVADQDAGDRGVMVDFFGVQASTPVGPAVLSYRTNTPLYTGYMIRTSLGKYKAFLEKVDMTDLSDDVDKRVKEITQRHTSNLEAYVREYPEHYFWFHKRWRSSGLYR